MIGRMTRSMIRMAGRRRFLRVSLALSAVLSLALGSTAHAAPRLPAVFGDGMVIQRDVPIPVWGWASPGETVTVSFKGRTETDIVDEDGRWEVTLGALPADEISADLVVSTGEGKDKIVVTNVVVGDVWLASGQSNMAWTVERSANAEEEIDAARYPLIREMAVARRTATEPQEETEATWVVCSPETAGKFSAVGYYFARKLFRELDVPIGIINSTWGGTPVEAWTRRDALARDRRLMDIFVRWEAILGEFPDALERYYQAVKDWEEKKQLAASLGSEFNVPKPRPPRGPKHQHRPGNLYNAMINPLTRVPIKGVIWYQGESNAWNPEEYAVSFPVMIRDWRARWAQSELPFYFVQLASFAPEGQAEDGDWPWLREAQTAALNLPDTGMAVTIDIGERDDIHPRNKQDVGDRLARLALAKTYGRQIEYSGPTYKSMRVRRGVVELTFEHVAGGLAAFGSDVEGFEIAGEDRVFYPARARIEDNKVYLSNSQVSEPVAVRYAWDNFPKATLTNSEGLPAAPFRTDYWSRKKE